jgi:hypothetical protein
MMSLGMPVLKERGKVKLGELNKLSDGEYRNSSIDIGYSIFIFS